LPIISGGGGGGAVGGVTVTGIALAGQVPVASSSSAGVWAFPPGFQFDYAEFTVTVDVTTTTEAGATTIVTGSPVTYDGATVILVEYQVPVIQIDSSVVMRTVLYDGASSIGWLSNEGVLSLSAAEGARRMSRKLTPSAAAHTYSIRSFLNAAGTGHHVVGAGGLGNIMPGFMRITKV
jgi:hypothetical protein